MPYKVSNWTSAINEVKTVKDSCIPYGHHFFETRDEAVKWVHENFLKKLEILQQETNKAKKRLIAFEKRENLK